MLRHEMSRCNLVQQAFVKVYFLNAVATPSDFRSMRMGAARTEVDWPPAATQGSFSVRDFLEWQIMDYYPQPDVPQHGSAVLGLPDACEFLRHGDPQVLAWWVQLANASVGCSAWTLVAMAAWMTAADRRVLEWMSDCGWFSHRLVDSIEAMKSRLVAARRCLTLAGCRELPVDEVLVLRKMANLAGRNKDEADWVAEQHRRTVDTPVHVYPMADGSVSRAEWLRRLQAFLEGFTLRTATKMANTLRLEDIDTWWQSRYAWAPSGSSSNAAAAKAAMMHTEGLVPDNTARPNKKAVTMVLAEDYIWLNMLSKPVKKPRCSTKNEPGHKNRALYAQDDASFFISAFASVAMERSINEDGIYARQAPDDVVNWVRMHKLYSEQGCYFLSLDYSDYNTEHEMTALAMLDLCWAKAWLKIAAGRPVFLQKAAAAMWSAEAALNAWVDFGDGELRVTGGLFSGDRNTSRDNCILHAAYSHIMQCATADMLPDFEIFGLCMTGDDEDAAFSNWVHALAYMQNHMRAGFVLKIEKQLAGSPDQPTHEYLQRALTADGRPSQPLASTLAQMMSGNWYKEQYIWFDSIINSVNSNGWELHVRGLPLNIARFLTGKVLSRTLRARKDDRWVKLEWWRYRTNGAYAPLWGATTDTAPQLPDSKEVVGVAPLTHGLLAWRAKNAARFPELLPGAKMDRYIAGCSKQAFSSIYQKSRFKRLHEAASEVWPERETLTPDLMCYVADRPVRVGRDMLATLLTLAEAGSAPHDEKELMSRFGVDSDLLEALGGWSNFLQTLQPSDMQYWENVQQPGRQPDWLWYEDAAIRSWVTLAVGAESLDWERMIPSARSAGRAYDVVLAGNAAGKSTIMRSKYASRCVDMDDVMRRCGILTQMKRNPGLRTQPLSEHQERLLAHAMSRAGGSIILSQYPMVWVQQAVRSVNGIIDQVRSVVTDPHDVWDRTSNSRAWSMAKVERRCDRFMRTADHWCEEYAVQEEPDVYTAVQKLTNKIVSLSP